MTHSNTAFLLFTVCIYLNVKPLFKLLLSQLPYHLLSIPMFLHCTQQPISSYALTISVGLKLASSLAWQESFLSQLRHLLLGRCFKQRQPPCGCIALHTQCTVHFHLTSLDFPGLQDSSIVQMKKLPSFLRLNKIPLFYMFFLTFPFLIHPMMGTQIVPISWLL